MHRHFILLVIAILFELNKVASSWRWWTSYGKCTGIFNTGNVSCGRHRAMTCSLCPCNQQGVYQTHTNWCNGDCQWSRGACRPRNKCAGVIFNTGNVSCGRHRAKTCSQCTCNEQGAYGRDSNWCNGDCQWSNGACHMRRKINKGEWHSRNTIQGCCGGHELGSGPLLWLPTALENTKLKSTQPRTMTITTSLHTTSTRATSRSVSRTHVFLFQ